MISKLETTAYLALLFPSKTKCFHQCTRFPQNLSEDLPTIPLRVLSSGPRSLGKSERGERALGGRQDGNWIKNLTREYSQAWIFHQHYLISEDSLIGHP